MVDEVDEVVCHVPGAERVQEVTRVWLRDGETDDRCGPEREVPRGVEGRLDEGQSLRGKELDRQLC